MKKKILSIITSLALCLSLLPAAALAAEDSAGDNSATIYFDNTQAGWDTISALYHYGGDSPSYGSNIFDANESAEQVFALQVPEEVVAVMFRNFIPGQPEETLPNGYQSTGWFDVEAGKTYTYFPHVCADEDDDHLCDTCRTYMRDLCADEDGDHLCDTCWEYLPELCTDGTDEAIHVCDICWAFLPNLCRDEDDDHWCDFCDVLIESICRDEDDDHFCDNESCGNKISDCEECDWNEDNICDLCGENIHPGPGELNIDAIAGDGTITVTWDALEDAGTDPVAAYTVSCCLEESFEPLQQATCEPGSETYSHTFSGLDNHTVYDVSVEAVYTHIKDGYEDPFSATAITTVTALPGAPTVLSVTYGSGSVTVEWEAPENKGFPDILYYVITAEQNGIGIGAEVEATGEETMRYTLDGLLGGQSYQIYVSAVNSIGYGTAYTTTVDIPRIPYELVVGGVPVTVENMNDVLGDGTVSYDPYTMTLTLEGANITSGYAYKDGHIAGIYADGDLNIEVVGEENQITAPADVMSRGIRAEMLTISGAGTLTVVGGPAAATDEDAESVGIYATGGVTIFEANVITSGGSAAMTGDGSAYSNGIYTEGDLMVDFGGKLTASGGEATGKNAYSTGMDAYGSEDHYINITVYDDSSAEFTGGKTVGEAYSGSCGIYADQAGLYVYGSNAFATLRGSEAESTGTSEDAYAYSNGATIYAGDVEISSGTVEISSGPWTGLRGDGYALYVKADETEDADGHTYYSGGNVDIDCEDVIVSPPSSRPSLVGTKVTISSESGPAVYAQMGFDMGDTLTISSPAGAEIKGIGGSDDPDTWAAPNYYTIVDAEGTKAQSVSVEPLGYTVSIQGLSYGRAVLVPAGKSVNETYCETLGIADFSEALDTVKEGYTFRGWYTDEACTSGNEFTFNDEVTSDITIYPKWTVQSSGGGSSNTSTETTKNEDGSTTTTTTNKKTGEVTETVKTPAGVTGTVVTDKTGEVTEVSAKVPAAAAKDGAVVTLPLDVDTADEDIEIKVDVPSGGAVVEIPVENVTPGTVAVLVKADGTEEIIKTSAVTENGVVVELEKDATVKIVDNSKTFADVHAVDHWAEDAIDFVTARGIFGGTSATSFNPNGSMTRQAMWMVLSRMSGENPADMEETKAWAVESGISDGSAPTSATSRQQFVTMLWRWAKAQGVDVSVGEDTNILSYEDAFGISDYAIPAFQWACGAGVVSGYADGTLRPEAVCTRAHVAQMMMNFLNK